MGTHPRSTVPTVSAPLIVGAAVVTLTACAAIGALAAHLIIRLTTRRTP